MARIDDLVRQVADERLRLELASAVDQLRSQRTFGLVFEEHIPEFTRSPGTIVKAGSLVTTWSSQGYEVYRVESLHDDTAAIRGSAQEDSREVPLTDLVAVRRFGEPMYPTLERVERVSRVEGRPFHTVLNAENYHALQLLLYAYEGQVDCIYADPPYNTGARDWKYNNNYVDGTDQWRHSKWLSMMERRLRLAKRLLKPDGVLIVTIDEHEVHHLGMLLEQVMPEYQRQMVTIVVNPRGTAKANFGRVDEQALFCVPDFGRELILEQPATEWERLACECGCRGCRDCRTRVGGAGLFDQLEAADEDGADVEGEDPDSEPESEDELADETRQDWEYRHLRRRGSESSYRHQRPNQFYPLYLDEAEHRIVAVGEPVPLGTDPDLSPHDGLTPIYPIDREGRHRCWRYGVATMQRYVDAEQIVLGRQDRTTGAWTLNVRLPKRSLRKLKTVWWQTRHDAGTHGTSLVAKVLGQPGLFPFPKSIYAVRDCLKAVVGNRPDALILDYFAGSGTTLHATCLLNAEDGGRRRSIMVTNNEVDAKLAATLHRRGLRPGDDEYERQGIFRSVTLPRSKYVVNGKRDDGSVLDGMYLNGRSWSRGFEENVEFLNLRFVDPDDLAFRRDLAGILAVLWLRAGAYGDYATIDARQTCILPTDAQFAVLTDETAFARFKSRLAKRPDITHAFLVTDSEDAFREMVSQLPRRIRSYQLFRDYLENFRINVGRTTP